MPKHAREVASGKFSVPFFNLRGQKEVNSEISMETQRLTEMEKEK